MGNSKAVMDLIGQYETYADAAELNAAAAGEAPGTTAFCASLASGWISGQVISVSVQRTSDWSC